PSMVGEPSALSCTLARRPSSTALSLASKLRSSAASNRLASRKPALARTMRLNTAAETASLKDSEFKRAQPEAALPIPPMSALAPLSSPFAHQEEDGEPALGRIVGLGHAIAHAANGMEHGDPEFPAQA